MERIDVKYEKNEIRKKLKIIRNSIPLSLKKSYDEKIFENVVNLDIFNEAKIIYIYVSTEAEVDTVKIIKHLIAQEKTVAVPRMLDKAHMDFFYITSLSDLEMSSYSILEPKVICQKANIHSESICITPGLGYDSFGFRIGYGRGYYDRFFESYRGIKIGVCYDECILELPHNKFDVAVDLLITPNKIGRLNQYER